MSNDILNELKTRDNYNEIKEALNVGDYNMIVTHKEIDDVIENMKNVIAQRNKFCTLNLMQNMKNAINN